MEEIQGCFMEVEEQEVSSQCEQSAGGHAAQGHVVVLLSLAQGQAFLQS